MAKILLLLDERGRFTEKLIRGKRQNYVGTVDSYLICRLLQDKGHEVRVLHFFQLEEFGIYSGWHVVYSAAEDRGHFYKRYMEDVILGLKLAGALLIPDWVYLHALDNKAFQEILRHHFSDARLRTPHSRICFEEDEKDLSKSIDYPCVIKDSAGSGSSGVELAQNPKQFVKKSRALSAVSYHDHFYNHRYDLRYNNALGCLKTFIKNKALGDKAYETHISRLRKTIVIQEYLGGLSGDYKVLYFAGHYYVLRRENRKKDFRASGSGMFSFPMKVNEISRILDLAKCVASELKNTPMISMDIAENNRGNTFLLEFQCLSFGPYTQQYSSYYFVCNEKGIWTKCEKNLTLEQEIARSIDSAVGE